MLSPVMSSRGLAARGAAALILGVIVLLLPGPMLVGLTLVLGGYVLVNGILALASAFKKGVEGRGWLFLEAAVYILAGIVMFVRPLFTLVGLTYLIGSWAVLVGALQIGEAFVLRRYLRREGLYLLGGVVTLLLGLAILSGPSTGTPDDCGPGWYIRNHVWNILSGGRQARARVGGNPGGGRGTPGCLIV